MAKYISYSIVLHFTVQYGYHFNQLLYCYSLLFIKFERIIFINILSYYSDLYTVYTPGTIISISFITCYSRVYLQYYWWKI